MQNPAPRPASAAKPSAIKAPVARRPGSAIAQAKKPAGRKPNWLFVAGCACLMVCYFLPWFSLGDASLMGYEVSYHVPRFLLATWASPGLVLASNSLWAFAFIGIWALYTLGDEFSGLRRNRNRWWLRMITALSPFVALSFIVFAFSMLNADALAEIGRELSYRDPDSTEVATGVLGITLLVLSFSSFGLWAMFLGIVLCAVSLFVHPKSAAAQQPKPHETTTQQ